MYGNCPNFDKNLCDENLKKKKEVLNQKRRNKNDAEENCWKSGEEIKGEIKKAFLSRISDFCFR